MVKHVSIRFAWHDDSWDGGICRDPKNNFYCVGNYSLLSPRLQRRRLAEQEDKHKNESVPIFLSESDFAAGDDFAFEGPYAPPCYWTINAFGDKDIELEDIHPFVDTGRKGKEFIRVPPLRITLKKNTVITWCFKIGFGRNDYERYVPPSLLEQRTSDYLKSLEKEKSIAFFYANFSNPISGEDRNRKYLLIGAGLVAGIEEPPSYDIPSDLLKKVRAQKRMENLPTLAWQFQVTIDPESTFLLPYKQYYDWVREDELNRESRQEKLEELAVKVDDRTIIPHFKYVSMHLPHDKAIYLLYQTLNSLKKMRENPANIQDSIFDEIEAKTKKLLEVAWKERGQYPGFRNILFLVLENDFQEEELQVIISKIEHQVKYRLKGIHNFLNSKLSPGDFENLPRDVSFAMRIIENGKDLVKFFAAFDFTIVQFTNIRKILKYYGPDTVRSNPYLFLEHYSPTRDDEKRRDPNIDKNDYGIGLYQIDIAMIPDHKYADWESSYNAQSPERVRALIAKILAETASSDGRSFLYRKDIVKKIEEYPLYYISNKFKVDDYLLSQYEKQGVFRDKFLMKDDVERNDVIYQLRSLENVEKTIEEFLEIVLKKRYKVDENEIRLLKRMDFKKFGNKVDLAEREEIYRNALGNGLFVLSGIAGSGKTQAIINLLSRLWENGNRSICVFTPTGKANLVIRGRLKEFGLHNKEPDLLLSTIHRFLYRSMHDRARNYRDFARRQEAEDIGEIIEDILSEGKWELIEELKSRTRNKKFKAKIVVIDEASMVDEILLATLFAMIDPYEIEHLILSGDERQLPPIGVGRPLVDLAYDIQSKWRDLESNITQLKTNLRFDPTKKLANLADLFGGEDEPGVSQVAEILSEPDDSLEVRFFSDAASLESLIREVLLKAGALAFESESAFEVFANLFVGAELTGGEIDLDRVQIITPRRIGSFGSEAINRNVIMRGEASICPQSKLICEENMYTNVGYRRILGLANGSIGYVTSKNVVRFNEVTELEKLYGPESIEKLKKDIRSDVFSSMKIEKKINFGYAITVHKSQGSDFDHVILVLPDKSLFVTKELLYTAITRPKEMLHIIVNKKLEKELPAMLVEAFLRSEVEAHDSLLFGHKHEYRRPFKLTLSDGSVVALASKIEYMIADCLDKLNVKFEYECSDFLEKYRFKPDFKFRINDKTFYLEHLGNLNRRYANTRNWKFDIYKKAGYADNLITTSERDEDSNVKAVIEKIIHDLQTNKLENTPGAYSYHHYYL